MDARYFDYQHMPDSDPFQNMFKYSPKVDTLKEELHISKPDRFSKLNSTVADEITDREDNTASLYTSLLSSGLQIMINVGQFDMKDGVRQTLEWIKGVDFDGRSQFNIQPRKVYTYYDQNDSSTELIGGYYRHHENFTVIIVPGAGHMVAASQPYLTMKFVMDYINKGHLSCETIDGGSCKSVGEDMCTYMNDCNGHGSCSSKTDGKCVCDEGFYGSDCTSEVDALLSDMPH